MKLQIIIDMNVGEVCAVDTVIAVGLPETPQQARLVARVEVLQEALIMVLKAWTNEDVEGVLRGEE